MDGIAGREGPDMYEGFQDDGLQELKLCGVVIIPHRVTVVWSKHHSEYVHRKLLQLLQLSGVQKFSS